MNKTLLNISSINKEEPFDNMYKNKEELQQEIDSFAPKNLLDYVLYGSQLNRWFEYVKNKKNKTQAPRA